MKLEKISYDYLLGLGEQERKILVRLSRKLGVSKNTLIRQAIHLYDASETRKRNKKG